MIFWFTGQPGHGKTLHALDMALDFKDKGRIVYACNVRGLDHEKSGLLPMTPAEFKTWTTTLPDGSVVLCDEAYEHGMLPKRAPGSKVPEHVEQLAKHRHRGLDFIFVCQSPDTQCDSFVRDLIDRHVHVRRKWGTSVVNLREFDRFERNAVKATPLSNRLVKLPKRPMGLYESTVIDTTEKRIPWIAYALICLVALAAVMIAYSWYRVDTRFEKTDAGVVVNAEKTATGENGAGAKVESGGGFDKTPLTLQQYVDQFIPRINSQPWSAPFYDDLSKPSHPPRVFCIIGGDPKKGTCTCLTEQGTKYAVDLPTCRHIAVNGQYEPYRDEKADQRDGLDGTSQQRHLAEERTDILNRNASASARESKQSQPPQAATGQPYGTQTSYGDIGIK